MEFEEIPRGTVKVDRASLMIQLIQSLPFPGKLSLRHQVAVKEAQVAATMFKQAEWDMTSMLKSVYYDLFLVDRELEVQEEQAVWLSQAVASAQSRYATGAALQAEALRAQAEALEASNRVTVLIHHRKALEAHINHLLNRPAQAPVGSPEALPLVPVPSSPDRLLIQAMEHQPELLAFRFSVERAEAAWRLSKRELLPDLETMMELRDPAMGPIGPWDLTLGLVLPFWFWTKQSYGVKVALYDKESAQAAYQGMQNEIQRRIHEHWHEAQAAYETARLCQEGLIPLARQAVTSALAAYQGGRGSFLEVMDALVALRERERTYAEHLVALEQHIVMLEQAVGVPLRQEHGGIS
jgi:outer membrane protein TolC